MTKVITETSRAEVITRQVDLQANQTDVPRLAWTRLVDVKANCSSAATGNDRNTAAKQPTPWRYVGDAVNPDTDERHCPALKSKCNKYHKRGHWEQVSLSKGVREVEEEQSYFLGEVSTENKSA